MPRASLPTIPATASSEEGCPDCTRRLVVQGLGVTAAASLLGLGCGGGDDGPTPDAGDPLIGTMMCGANLCVLLNDPANALLLNVEGSRVISLPNEKLLIVRSAVDDFVVLSAVCTHAGCTVRYDAPTDQAVCPCHGSRFTLSGTVAMGPAARSLERYTATYDAAMQTVTIVL
jgi:Rieske Fe-S protein